MTLYLDVDTQLDFVYPAGALYVPGAEQILPRVAARNREAIEIGAKLVSTLDAHRENDPEFRAWPHHCVEGALGARKPEATLVPGAHFLPKQSVDCFTNPQLAAWLQEWEIQEALVYGVVTEICVQHAAFGLLARGIQVTVDSQAVKELSTESCHLFFAEVRARGGAIL